MLPALGWVHLVALGWLTMTAFAVLVHVVPAFTGAAWWGEDVARHSVYAYAAGVVMLVAAFVAGAARLLPPAGVVVAGSLLCYVVPAAVTLGRARRGSSVERAVARALAVTLAALLPAAALGAAFTFVLAGWGPAALVNAGAPIHAELGGIGWLTLLVMGVSTRTVRPITGSRSRAGWRHVAASSAVLGALPLLAAGSSFAAPDLTRAGVALAAGGVAVFVADVIDVLRRATVRHRPPQAFFAASALWLAVATALMAATVMGHPCARALVFVGLIGWLGQAVNAHVHHIGVRLLATAFRGDDDETPPDALLSRTLSWTTFVLFQAAVLVGVLGLTGDSPALLAAGSAAGFLGWCAMAMNAAHAVRRARLPFHDACDEIDDERAQS